MFDESRAAKSPKNIKRGATKYCLALSGRHTQLSKNRPCLSQPQNRVLDFYKSPLSVILYV